MIVMKYCLNQGFTLIEILVTVLVLSIGVLGVSALLLLSLQNTIDSSHKSYAIYLAENLFERMRANPLAASDYINSDYGMGEFAVTAAVNCKTTSCNSGELADFDMVAWHRLLRNKNTESPTDDEADADSGNRLLPNAEAVVTQIVDNPAPLSDVYQVRIEWSRLGDDTIPSKESYSLMTEI
jgi:type IV pilus modification protein PilV